MKCCKEFIWDKTINLRHYILIENDLFPTDIMRSTSIFTFGSNPGSFLTRL